MFGNRSNNCDDDDPCWDPFRTHRERMYCMMQRLSEPLCPSTIPAIKSRQRQMEMGCERECLPDPCCPPQDMNSTFEMIDRMISNMREMMEEIQRKCEDQSTDCSQYMRPRECVQPCRPRPCSSNGRYKNGQSSFRCSSVMKCCKTGNEPAKFFEATSTTCCAPGGLKETRQTMKDSQSGVEQMRIGHYIGDRGRIIERTICRKTGQQECRQNFHNMDECEADCFDQEWQREMSKFRSSSHQCVSNNTHRTC